MTTQSQQTLQILASSNPDFPAFVSGLGAEANVPPLPPELLIDTLAVLGEDPQTAAAIAALSNNPNARKSFVTGGEIAALFAVAFVLRTHIKLERTTTGKWKLLIEHQPADSKQLTTLLKKLADWINGSNP